MTEVKLRIFTNAMIPGIVAYGAAPLVGANRVALVAATAFFGMVVGIAYPLIQDKILEYYPRTAVLKNDPITEQNNYRKFLIRKILNGSITLVVGAGVAKVSQLIMSRLRFPTPYLQCFSMVNICQVAGFVGVDFLILALKTKKFI